MNQWQLPSPVSSELMTNSKSEPSPRRFDKIMSRFNSNTDMPVPSKATRVGSFCDLKRKKTDEVMATGHLAIEKGTFGNC